MLGFKSLDELYEIPFTDYQGWLSYLEQRPIGWRDDLRFSMIIRALGSKQKPEEMFPSLAPIFNKESKNQNLRNSAFFLKMLSAKGGEHLDILEAL